MVVYPPSWMDGRLLGCMFNNTFVVILTELSFCFKYYFRDYCLLLHHLAVWSVFPTFLHCRIMCALSSFLVFVSFTIYMELIWIRSTDLCVRAHDTKSVDDTTCGCFIFSIKHDIRGMNTRSYNMCSLFDGFSYLQVYVCSLLMLHMGGTLTRAST